MNENSQKISKPRPGQELTAAYVRQLVYKAINGIVGGKGILVRRMGDQTLIESRAVGGGGGGGGGTPGWAPIKIASLELLNINYPPEDQDLDALAVITDGGEKYGWYEIADDGAIPIWRPRNFWKSS